MLKHLNENPGRIFTRQFSNEEKQLKQVLFMGLPRNCWTSENK